MPELPEVETIRRQLSKYIIGKKIAAIEVFKKKSWSGDSKKLIGQKIQEIQRRSKVLWFILGKDLNILIHLKMSGQLIYVDGQKRAGGGHPTADWVNELPSPHTRVMVTFSDKTKLFFNDQRIFGWLRMMNDKEVETEFAKLAPDITDPKITGQYLFEKYQKRAVPVKQMLMDNSLAAGVGNIYACDALNLAKISPKRPAKTLSLLEVKKLLESARTVIKLGIQHGGATVHGEYITVEGLAGKYQTVMRVYNKKDQPCPNCGKPIHKIRLGGRGTYYCPNCQI